VVVLNDAYNANPTSVGAALETLVAVERTGRTWAVLGVMAEIGDTHDAEHEAVGARVRDLGVDQLVVVGDEAAGIAAGAHAAAGDLDHVTTVPDAAAALQHLLSAVAPGDVVLVKASRVGGLEAVAEGLVAARAPATEGGDHDAEVARP
jgi:UDP-N-acetylmuramoyl-tripeptide--D-alanyl-D-alanine ligase